MDIQSDPDSTWPFPLGPQMTIWESLLHPSITSLDSRICFCFSAFIAFKCLYAFFTPVRYGKFNPGLTPTSRFALTGQQATIIMNLPCIIVPAILLAITNVFHFSRNLKINLQWTESLTRKEWAAIVLFVGNYFHRTFIYGYLRMKNSNCVSISVVIFAWAAAAVNGYLVTKYTIFWGRELGD
jgi:hypothetical protein